MSDDYDWLVTQGLHKQSLKETIEKLRAIAESEAHQANIQYQHKVEPIQRMAAEIEATPALTPPLFEPSHLLSEAEAKLVQAGMQIGTTRCALEGFQIRHGCLLEPTNPDLLQACINTLLMILLEASINVAFMLNAYMSASPSQAYMTCAVISGTNIIFSTCLGYFAGRWTNYGINAADVETNLQFKWIRQKARITIWAAIPIFVGFHLSVGLIRSQESLTTVQHSLNAYIELLTTPEALFLVITGACLSFIAFSKGKKSFDDPYGDYGAHLRAKENALDDLYEMFEEYKGRINDLAEEAMEKIAAHEKKWKERIVQYNKALASWRDAFEMLTKSVAQCEKRLKEKMATCIQAYRSARGRKSSSTLNEVSQPISFEKYLPSDPPVTKTLPNHVHAINDVTKRKSEALDQLNKLLREVLETSGKD